MVSISVPTGTRDKLAVLKEDLGYDSWDDFLSDVQEYIETNIEAFDEAFPEDEDEDETEDEE